MEKLSIKDALKGLNGTKFNLAIKEAYVTSLSPFELQCVTDNGLIISDSNLYPIGDRFGMKRKKAIVYYNDAEMTTKEIEIEIDNTIKVDDLFLVIEVDNGETCRYILLDRL